MTTNDSQPLVVYRSADREGATYALEPLSLERLRKSPLGESLHVRSRVFIAHETRAEYDEVHSNITNQILQLLTGLAESRLNTLGPVVFRDAATDQDLPRSA